VCGLLSRHLRAFRADVEGVEGLAGGHEEAIFLGAAETDICAIFGKMNFADEFAVGREDVHAVVMFVSPSGGGPHVAIDIATNAIRIPRRHIDKHAAVFEVRAVDNIVDADLVRVVGMFWSAGIDDVEKLFVRRKTKAVGLVHVGGDDGDFARFGIETIDDGGYFEGRFVAFVIGHDAVAGIAKPDGAVGMRDDVVGSVEFFALVIVHQNRDGAVVLGTRDAARIVFAGEQAALSVAVIAIAVVGRTAKNADFSRVFEPSQHAVVGNIAEQKITAITEPNGALGPARACVEPFDGGVDDFVFRKARVNHLDCGIGI